jgi:hypothetical protein
VQGWLGATCTQSAASEFLGIPLTQIEDLTNQIANGITTPTSATGAFTAGDTTVVLYPQGAAMRLYACLPAPAHHLRLQETHQPEELQEIIAALTCDYVQLTQSHLIEMDGGTGPSGKAWPGDELAGQFYPIAVDCSVPGNTCGTWEYVQPPESSLWKTFIYRRTGPATPSLTQVAFSLTVRYYANAAAVPLDGSLESVVVGAGALKFTVEISPWPFTDITGNHLIKWVAYVSSAFDSPASKAQAQQVGTQQRLPVSGTDGTEKHGFWYDTMGGACSMDFGQACYVYITYEWDLASYAHQVTHLIPYYQQQFKFDPILTPADPNAPTYPAWVEPSNPSGASVIRDPRKQFQGAATLHTSALAVVLASLVALVAARV